jgi:iron complex outermembrane receptor protein
MKQQRCNRARTGLFTALAGLFATSVSAQGILEEVVVTAQKRETTLSETPIAITAISAGQLQDFGLYTAQDISNFTPNMSFQEIAGGGEGNRIYLRGIGRETSSAGTEPGVGVYNNGFYSNESAALALPVDLAERIEVLRGPQGTLFGRNTTGGAINVVTKKPGDEFEHIVRGRLGNYDAKNLELTSSGPLTDNLGYLLHYSQLDRDSFTTNVSGPDPRGTDADYIEGQLDIDITDNVNWNIRYFSASFDNETLELAKLDGYRNEPGAPSKLGELVVNPELFSPIAVAPDSKDPFKRSSDFSGRVAVDDQQSYQSTLTIDFDALTVRILNGYQDSTWESAKDFDGTASPASFIEQIGQAETNTQHEIQLISNGSGGLDWILGLFYLKNENDQPYTLFDSNNPFLTDLEGNPAGIFYNQLAIVESVSTAIYGQVDWAVTDRLSVSAGLRYSEDDKDASEEQQIYYDSVLDFCGNAFLPEFIASGDPYFTPAGCFRIGAAVSDLSATHKESWNAVNWRLNANYSLGEASMAYATISTGYKPGGFRLGAMQDDPTTSQNESVVNNEELTAYEIGFKGTIGNVLSVSSAVFLYDYKDIQVELGILDSNTGIVTAKLDNASSTDVYGFELESTWAASEKLTVLANYSYLNSEYKDDFFVSDNKTNDVRNVRGNELNRTPNNKFTLAATYVQPVGEGAVLFSGNYSWIDEQYITVFNDSIETIQSYAQLNGRISWQPHGGGYQLAIYGQNITDELSYANGYSVSALADGVRRSGTPISPRTYGVELVLLF